ncbi:hypothetical protein [Microlunatus ginsengisoli]|uniref:hypothetical protein n=1 Tax=Microlunatus ginsengisoli TaxID=363863 RepID=UPI0031E23728
MLDRWWGIAHLRLNPPTEEERDLVHRLHAGGDVGWPHRRSGTPIEVLKKLMGHERLTPLRPTAWSPPNESGRRYG